MRQLSVVALTAVLVLMFGTPVMAQELLKVTGWVSKIDTAGREHNHPARRGDGCHGDHE